MTSEAPYRLDDLGWLQFDRLCSLVLEADAGLSDVRWRGRSETGRVARVEDDIVLPECGIRLTGPATVAVAWVREEADADHRLSRFIDRLARAPAELEDRMLVLTNLDGGDALAAIRGQKFAEHKRVAVLGAGDLGSILDRDPRMRLAMPSVLGLRDLEPMIDPDVRGRSSFDVERATELARVFWPTRAYGRALAVLGRHRFVVLTGPPEMGKTAIAQMVALAQLTDGWEAHECTDPDQISRVFNRDRRQVFVADDAFGSTEYRPDAAERWGHSLGRLLTMLDSHHWLIWTSRPAPLKAGLRSVQRERGSERFPAPGEVLVDASDLDLAEKTLILFRHAKGRGVSHGARALLRYQALSIVEHPYFTPERIRRFVSDRLEELLRLPGAGKADLVAIVERELASPTEAMRTSFEALGREHRELLISLLDTPAGLIDEREFAATVRRHYAGGLSRAPGELIDRLMDHFLRVTPLGIGWVHPSWRDLVIDELRRDAPARRRFLAGCGVDGASLALSQAGGIRGERTMPLLISDEDWDTLGDRLHQLLRELEDKDIARIFLTLSGAIRVTFDRRLGEAHSLAMDLLRSTAQVWDQRHCALPVFLLEAWYALDACAPERPPPPRLEPTWAELHPGLLLFEDPHRGELSRADEWLALAQLLDRYDPGALRALAFFERDRDLLEKLIVTLARAAPDEDLNALCRSVLARIEELVPDLAPRAHSATDIRQLAERVDSARWWVPEDIPVLPSTDLVAVSEAEFRREDVGRVLSDL